MHTAILALGVVLWPPAAARAQCSLTNATTWCAHQDLGDVSGGAEDDDHFGGALAFGDFNGDGFDDLAVGAPGENGAGFVHVFYSNGSLLTLAGQQLFSQDDLAGADGGQENGDGFGRVLATGDFDGDGFDDLVIGSPGEDLPELSPSDCSLLQCEDTGCLHVVYGGASGLAVGSAAYFDGFELDPNLARVENAGIGSAFAVGDFLFPSDGIDDLVIGAPGVSSDPDFRDGVLYFAVGRPAGLDADSNVAPARADPADDFEYGGVLAAGQFATVGGTLELAVGTPLKNVFSGSLVLDAGGVFLPDPIHLDPSSSGSVIQSHYGSAGDGVDDHFGAALATGDFDANGFDDLAASAPNKDHGAGNPNDSGRVYVAYNAGSGPQPETGSDIIGEDEWAGDTPGAGEHFGNALAAGDVDGDGFDDLLAGAPNEGSADVGRVYLKRGSATGLTTVRNELFTQTFLGGSNGDDDHLGNVIALGDVDGDGSLDIALGVPDKDVSGHTDAGMVYVTRAFARGVFSDGFESGNKGAWSASTP